MEYWQECDEEVDCDFEEACMDQGTQQNSPSLDMDTSDELADRDHEAIVWWLVTFTQTVHSLSSRAVEWLLKFIGALLTILGRYSVKVATLAHVFPRSLHLRTKYLDSKLCPAKIVLKVVCQECHALYDFSDCFHQRGSHITMKCCSDVYSAVEVLRLLC